MTSSLAYTTDTPTAFLTRMADAMSAADGTFAFDPRTGREVRTGYTVADDPDAERYYTGKITHEDISAYLWDHVADVMRPGVVVCGWRHGATGAVYLYTARVVLNRETAETRARETGNVIYTSLASGRAVRV